MRLGCGRRVAATHLAIMPAAEPCRHPPRPCPADGVHGARDASASQGEDNDGGRDRWARASARAARRARALAAGQLQPLGRQRHRRMLPTAACQGCRTHGPAPRHCPCPLTVSLLAPPTLSSDVELLKQEGADLPHDTDAGKASPAMCSVGSCLECGCNQCCPPRRGPCPCPLSWPARLPVPKIFPAPSPSLNRCISMARLIRRCEPSASCVAGGGHAPLMRHACRHRRLRLRPAMQAAQPLSRCFSCASNTKPARPQVLASSSFRPPCVVPPVSTF